MLCESNRKAFGEKLKDLRKHRYKESPKMYSFCKTAQLFSEEITNELKNGDKTIQRQTYCRWENGDNFPSIQNLIVLCKLLKCEPNYLLGYSEVIRQDVETVSTVTGLEPRAVEELQENNTLVKFLNFLLVEAKPDFVQLVDYIEKEVYGHYLGYDLLEQVAPKMRKIMQQVFSCTLTTPTTPFSYEDHFVAYKQQLKRDIVHFCKTKDDQSVLRQILNEDIIKEIAQRKSDNDISDDSEESYSIIAETLADFSYEPLYHMQMWEWSSGRMMQMFAGLAEKYLKSETNKLQARIRKFYSGQKNDTQ